MLEKREISIAFKGDGGPSFRTEMRTGDMKQRIISDYEIFVFDEKTGIRASRKTEDQFVVQYEEERIKAILRKIEVGDSKKWKPIRGLFCAVWIEKRKKNDLIRFLWFNTCKNSVQQFDIKTLGFEVEIIKKIFQLVVGGLIELLEDVTVKDSIEHSSETLVFALEEK